MKPRAYAAPLTRYDLSPHQTPRFLLRETVTPANPCKPVEVPIIRRNYGRGLRDDGGIAREFFGYLSII